MSETLGISPKPPEVILPESESDILTKLREGVNNKDREKVENIVASHPRDLFAWAALSILQDTTIGAYATARVGYHRGLDTLRANGWRGSGYVRADHPSNRGFLSCLAFLGHWAGQINETDEFERCQEFLQQLDPSFKWDDFDYDHPIDFLFGS